MRPTVSARTSTVRLFSVRPRTWANAVCSVAMLTRARTREGARSSTAAAARSLRSVMLNRVASSEPAPSWPEASHATVATAMRMAVM